MLFSGGGCEEDADSQTTVQLTVDDENVKEEPVVSIPSIHRVVSFSQSFSQLDEETAFEHQEGL